MRQPALRHRKTLRIEALESRLLLATFVVSTAGNDSAAGNEHAPWRTLQRAVKAVTPGDTVLVRAGNYAGFDLWTSGTESKPITFKADAGVKITSPNTRTKQDGINLEQASHIVIDGFQINQMPRAGIRAVGGGGNDLADDIVIRNNKLDSNGRWGIFTGWVDDLLIENNVTSRSKTEHGIYVSNSGDRPVIRNNTVWGNADSGIQLNGDVHMGGDGIISGALVERNTIYGNGYGGGAAINLDGVQNSRFQNNLLYDNHASGISLHKIDGAQGSKGNIVINNTILQASDARWVVNIQNGSTSNVLRNNILLTYHKSRGSINISADSRSGFVSDYNILTPRFTLNDSTVIALANWRTITGQDAHSQVATVAQVFKNAAGKDFSLAAGSPAINRGSSVSAPVTDIGGRDRPAGGAWDIGAYEKSGTVTTPTIPTAPSKPTTPNSPTKPTKPTTPNPPVTPASTPRSFDFGSSQSPLVAGFTRITLGNHYNQTRGYGWLNTTGLTSKTRDTSNSLASDFIFGNQATFAVDLPNGTYTVKITLGKTSFGYDQNAIHLEGVRVGTINASVNQVKVLTYTVKVTDGQLTLTLKDLGGATPSFSLAGLEITKATTSTKPTVPTPPTGGGTVPKDENPSQSSTATPRKFDFGSKTSALVSGHARVTAATKFNATSGFGWVGNTASLQEKTRSSGGLASDFVYGEQATFAVKVPNGKYKVVLTLGKTSYGYDKNAVYLEGARVATVAAKVDEVKVLTYEVTVKDGQLTLTIKDEGGKTPSFLLAGLELIPVTTTKAVTKTTKAATKSAAASTKATTLATAKTIATTNAKVANNTTSKNAVSNASAAGQKVISAKATATATVANKSGSAIDWNLAAQSTNAIWDDVVDELLTAKR